MGACLSSSPWSSGCEQAGRTGREELLEQWRHLAATGSEDDQRRKLVLLAHVCENLARERAASGAGVASSRASLTTTLGSFSPLTCPHSSVANRVAVAPRDQQAKQGSGDPELKPTVSVPTPDEQQPPSEADLVTLQEHSSQDTVENRAYIHHAALDDVVRSGSPASAPLPKLHLGMQECTPDLQSVASQFMYDLPTTTAADPRFLYGHPAHHHQPPHLKPPPDCSYKATLGEYTIAPISYLHKQTGATGAPIQAAMSQRSSRSSITGSNHPFTPYASLAGALAATPSGTPGWTPIAPQHSRAHSVCLAQPTDLQSPPSTSRLIYVRSSTCLTGVQTPAAPQQLVPLPSQAPQQWHRQHRHSSAGHSRPDKPQLSVTPMLQARWRQQQAELSRKLSSMASKGISTQTSTAGSVGLSGPQVPLPAIIPSAAAAQLPPCMVLQEGRYSPPPSGLLRSAFPAHPGTQGPRPDPVVLLPQPVPIAMLPVEPMMIRPQDTGKLFVKDMVSPDRVSWASMSSQASMPSSQRLSPRSMVSACPPTPGSATRTTTSSRTTSGSSQTVLHVLQPPPGAVVMAQLPLQFAHGRHDAVQSRIGAITAIHGPIVQIQNPGTPAAAK